MDRAATPEKASEPRRKKWTTVEKKRATIWKAKGTQSGRGPTVCLYIFWFIYISTDDARPGKTTGNSANLGERTGPVLGQGPSYYLFEHRNTSLCPQAGFVVSMFRGCTGGGNRDAFPPCGCISACVGPEVSVRANKGTNRRTADRFDLPFSA